MGYRKQYAALPYVVSRDGIELCLITSRSTGRWLIPKGWPQKGMAPHKLAALEAFEEAGLKGTIDPRPIGSFRYMKQLGDGSEIECDVSVYPMLVDYQAINWPEQEQRTIIWVKPQETVKLVDNEKLADILREFTYECSPTKK
ncbi:MAG: NUDIX hydrolase [Kiloniellales bacterium]|nr:NUDIX hydrolase [Kiloniellales bacterium]